MNIGLISSRYAYTLLEYAISLDQQQEVYHAMKIFSGMFMQTPKLRHTLQNRSISVRDKKDVIAAACGGNLPSSLDKTIDLVFKNRREELFQYITLRFIDMYRERYHIQCGKLVTAVPIDPEREKQFIQRIQQIAGGSVEVEPEVDPGIIGGFVLTLGDNRWDASISGELTRIRSKLRGVEENSLRDRNNGR